MCHQCFRIKISEPESKLITCESRKTAKRKDKYFGITFTVIDGSYWMSSNQFFLNFCGHFHGRKYRIGAPKNEIPLWEILVPPLTVPNPGSATDSPIFIFSISLVFFMGANIGLAPPKMRSPCGKSWFRHWQSHIYFLVDGTITVEDLENYYAPMEKPLTVRLYNGNYTVIAPQPPSSGVVLEFMLKILDGKYFRI